LANALHGLGLRKGDRVALLAYNCVEWMELYVGLARAGLVAVPINFRLTSPEIHYIVQHCDARALVVQDDLLARVQTIRTQLEIPPERFIHFGAAAAPVGWTTTSGAALLLAGLLLASGRSSARSPSTASSSGSR
jgi:acyl-CoA synthetase (AMP-forming)/AMP-acid ligase II